MKGDVGYILQLDRYPKTEITKLVIKMLTF